MQKKETDLRQRTCVGCQQDTHHLESQETGESKSI